MSFCFFESVCSGNGTGSGLPHDFQAPFSTTLPSYSPAHLVQNEEPQPRQGEQNVQILLQICTAILVAYITPAIAITRHVLR